MNKLLITLMLSASMTPSFAEEIEDGQRARYCFSLEDTTARMKKELADTQPQITRQQIALDAQKKKLDRDIRNIKAADEIDKGRLTRWEAENKKHTQDVASLEVLKQKSISLSSGLEESFKNKEKFKCNDKYSEEAVEKICVIDKNTGSACTRLLSGPMKHLKE